MKAQQLGVAAQGFCLLVKDASNNYYQLNAEGLNALMMLGEALWTEDILDARNANAEVTVPLGTVPGLTFTDDIEVPSGEIWIVDTINLVAPADDATGTIVWNALCSGFPLTALGVAKGILSVDRVPLAAQTETIKIDTGFADDPAGYGVCNVPRNTGLGIQLRVVGPATITLFALTATAAFTAAYTVDLYLGGRKVHKVVG